MGYPSEDSMKFGRNSTTEKSGCSDSKTSAAVLKNIGQSKLIFGENIADVLLTFGKNVLRLE
jgi:hypothetical protein